MFYKKEIQFHSNAVLRSEDLNEIGNYPRDIAGIFYKDYSDGIIEGAEVSVRNGRLVIAPGIIKYNSRIYHSPSETVVNFRADGKQQYLRLRFWDKNAFSGVDLYEAEAIVTDQPDMFPYEIELARFLAESGADLQRKQDTFADLFVSYNNLDFKNVIYASRSGNTLAPIITKTFAREMFSKDLENGYDIAFANTCLQNTVVDGELIRRYVAKRLKRDVNTDITNFELCKLLRQIAEGAGKQEQTRGKLQERRIIVD